MSLVSLSTPLIYPEKIALEAAGTANFANALLNASGANCGVVFTIPKTGTISKIGFRTGTVTTADDLTISLETVTLSTGAPSGTNYGGSSPGTLAAASLATNSWFWVTLATPATAVQGDLVAIKIAISFVDGNLQIAYAITGIGGQILPYPYTQLPSFARFTTVPNFALEYNDGTRPYMLTMPTLSLNGTVLNGATLDEVGNRFKLPFAARCTGIVVRANRADVGTQFIARLYDAAGNLVANTPTLEGDTWTQTTHGAVHIPFSVPVEIEPNMLYRAVVFTPQAATDSIAVWSLAIDSVGTMEAIGAGIEWYRTSRTDGGAWTDINTERIYMALVLDKIGNYLAVGLQSWLAARAQLVTLLGTVSITSPVTQTIKKVYATPPGTVQDKPCFIIYPPAVATERNMGGLRIDRLRIRIALVIEDADKDRAAELVSAYIDRLGTLIDENITLNDTVTVVTGQETEEGSSIALGGKEYQGCISFLTLEIKQTVTYGL